MTRLLLLSNSRNPGQGYLAHAIGPVADFLHGVTELLFFPQAAVTFEAAAYRDRVAEALAPTGVLVRSVVDEADPVGAVARAEALVVGGGNSFALLARLEQAGLLEPLRRQAREGVRYLGWSAGANLACPTISTTNDMPIARPGSFDALGLVPFQINPHYTAATIPGHGGESRDERLAEFLTLHPGVRVVGLREGSILRGEGGRLVLLGPHSLRLFEHGRGPRELGPDQELDFLLQTPG